MNGITELAKLLKERENSDGYSPMFGTVIELPNTKIRISDKVILTDTHITLCINLKEQNSDGEYINLVTREKITVEGGTLTIKDMPMILV